jgi:hypothetical protein
MFANTASTALCLARERRIGASVTGLIQAKTLPCFSEDCVRPWNIGFSDNRGYFAPPWVLVFRMCPSMPRLFVTIVKSCAFDVATTPVPSMSSDQNSRVSKPASTLLK